ncbi:MAG: CHAT domain-containing tetratricopeptide repeat protein [Spirulinaceae cyanobacterium]
MQLQRLWPTALFTSVITLSTTTSLEFPSLLSAKQASSVELPPDKPLDTCKAEANRLLQEGIEKYNTNQFEVGIQYLQQALIICQQLEHLQGEGIILSYLGEAYSAGGNYSLGLKYYEKSLQIARKTEFNQLKELIASQIALQASFISDYFENYQDAANLLELALTIHQELEEHKLEESETLEALGSTYNLLGNYVKAIEFYEQSLAVLRELQNSPNWNIYSELVVLNILGETYSKIGNYSKSIESHQQRLAILRELQDESSQSNTLGNLVKQPPGSGDVLEDLGKVYYLLEKYDKAIDYYQQSWSLTQNLDDRSAVFKASILTNLGAALFASGKSRESEKSLRDGINFLESSLPSFDPGIKVEFLEDNFRPYSLLQKVLVSQNKTDAALDIAELSKARAFSVLLASRLNINQKSELSTKPIASQQVRKVAQKHKATLVKYSIIYDDKKALIDQSEESELLIWVISPTGEIEFRQVDLRTVLHKQGNSVAEIVANTRNFIIKGITRGSTNSNELNLAPGDFVKLKGDLLRWEPRQVVAVDPENGTITVRFSGNQEELLEERPLTDVVEIVESPRINNSDLQQLHQLLIEPIADLLPTDPEEHIIFIPHRELFLVPFPALQDSEGTYLIEKHTILTAPAIDVLDKTYQLRQQVRENAQDILVVGNPTMPKVSLYPGEEPQQLSPLENSEKEAKEIAKLLQAKAITGGQATETAIKPILSNAKLIHLATHGLLGHFRRLGGAIALAPSESDNGLLTAEEILDLKLNAELVVLSACNTGQGRLTSDGVIGISRSLITAGVPSVIVSLWLVPDASTSELMTDFYHNLQANQDIAQALRQAMLTTIKVYPDPRDWAAFTLIGQHTINSKFVE